MKKLSLILALVLSLASSAFVGQPQMIDLSKFRPKKSDFKKSSDFDLVGECPKYEIKDDDILYYEGKPNGKGDDLTGLMCCGSKIKGYDEAIQRQMKPLKGYRGKPTKE